MQLSKLLHRGFSARAGGFAVAANGCHREEQKRLLDMFLFKRPGNIFWLWKDCFHRAILAIIN